MSERMCLLMCIIPWAIVVAGLWLRENRLYTREQKKGKNEIPLQGNSQEDL